MAAAFNQGGVVVGYTELIFNHSACGSYKYVRVELIPGEAVQEAICNQRR